MSGKFNSNLEMTRKAIAEIEKVSDSVSVWAIKKRGTLRGRITVRWTKSKLDYIAHIAFIMYSSSNCPYSIGGTSTLNGCGYNKINSGLYEIFKNLKTELSQYYAVNLPDSELEIINKWQYSFYNAGFEVFKAI